VSSQLTQHGVKVCNQLSISFVPFVKVELFGNDYPLGFIEVHKCFRDLLEGLGYKMFMMAGKVLE